MFSDFQPVQMPIPYSFLLTQGHTKLLKPTTLMYLTFILDSLLTMF